MRQGSEWLRELGMPPPKSGTSKLFTCWYSNCDNIVFPTSTATLRAADNRLVRGAGHLQLAFQPEVIEGTIDLITSRHHLDALQTDV
jgi:hypothetical protein